jgi:hypothetical protein
METVSEEGRAGFLVRYHDNGTLIGAVAVDQPDLVPDLVHEVTPRL